MSAPDPTVPEFLSRSADRIAPDGSPFRAMVLEILIEEYRRSAPEAPSVDADALAKALREIEEACDGVMNVEIIDRAERRTWKTVRNMARAALAAWDARRRG